MLKVRVSIIFFSVWMSLSSKAQLASETMRTFPSSVVTKIDAINSVLFLSQKRQIELGSYFRRQDSLANIARLKGASISQINEYYSLKVDHLATILTPLELNDYLTRNDNYSSKLAVAIKYRERLGLAKVQIDNLLKATKEFEKLEKNSKVNTADFVNHHLIEILNKDQVRHLLHIVYTRKATELSNKVWFELRQSDLLNSQDSNRLKKQLFSYELDKMLAKEPSQLLKTEYPKKPLILYRLDGHKNTLPKSQFAEAYQYRSLLQLQLQQLDSLLAKIVYLENLRSDFKLKNPGNYNSRTFEYENLVKILSLVQMQQFLESRNDNKSMLNANRDWAKLEEVGLTKGIDSIKVFNEIKQYELKWLVANDRLTMSKTQANAFARKDIQDKKPEILRLLDETTKSISTKTSTSKQLTW